MRIGLGCLRLLTYALPPPSFSNILSFCSEDTVTQKDYDTSQKRRWGAVGMFCSFLLPVNSMSIIIPGIKNSQLFHFSPKAKDQINSYKCEYKKIICLSFCGSTGPLDPSKERLLAFIHLSLPVPKVPPINIILNLSSLCKFLLFFKTNPFNLVRAFPLLRKFEQELPRESCRAACPAYAIH